MYAARKKAIQRVKHKRDNGFEAFRTRVESTESHVIDRRNSILAMDFFTLRDALQKDEMKAQEALEAYMWKALQVHDRLNCLTEVLTEAFLWAEEADDKWSGKRDKPPLFGVPFSVKGNFHMIGYDCSLGLGKMVEQPQTDECTFITHLRALGAVPFVITNVPQALLSFVCSNPVYGTTSNPYAIDRTPGGSSGGETALFAAGGAPFGTGSDLLGSLRIPAGFCGVTTMKPTEARLKVFNAHMGVPGRGRLGLGYGFFTRNVDEQIFLFKQIIGHPDYARLVPETSRAPLDDRKLAEGRKLKIGYFEEDGFLCPVPAMTRAVRDTVARLRSDGHEMVAFQVPDVERAVAMTYKNTMPDGGAFSISLYASDVVDKYMQQFVTLLRVPKCLRLMFSYMMKPLSPQFFLLGTSYVRDLEDLRYTQEITDEYKQQFIRYWKDLGIDALVCPAFAVPAMRHEFGSQLAVCGFATGLFNLLDLPAGTLPIDRVSKEDDAALLDDTLYPVGRNPILKIVRSAAKDSVGLPTAVQVVTLPQEEELCLNVMKKIEKLTDFQPDSTITST